MTHPHVRLVSAGGKHAVEYHDGQSSRWALFPSRDLAVAACEAMSKMITDDTPVTVAGFIDRWIEFHVLLRVDRPTTQAYLRYVRQLVRHLGDMALADVRAADIENYVLTRRAEGYCDPVLDRILNAWSSAFSTAERWLYIDTNPVIEFRASLLLDGPKDAE